MDDFLNGLGLLGIPAVILVPFLVEGVKRLGMPTKYAGVVALMIGVAVAGLIGSVEAWPVITPWVKYGVAGVLLGLGGAGVYSQAKYMGSRK